MTSASTGCNASSLALAFARIILRWSVLVCPFWCRMSVYHKKSSSNHVPLSTRPWAWAMAKRDLRNGPYLNVAFVAFFSFDPSEQQTRPFATVSGNVSTYSEVKSSDKAPPCAAGFDLVLGGCVYFLPLSLFNYDAWTWDMVVCHLPLSPSLPLSLALSLSLTLTPAL